MNKLKNKLTEKSRKYIRRKIRTNTVAKAVSDLPRLIVNRTNKFNYAQIVDRNWNVIASINDIKVTWLKKVESATKIWNELANIALKKWVDKVVFDRNWYLYHGRIKAIADWARQGWLKF